MADPGFPRGGRNSKGGVPTFHTDPAYYEFGYYKHRAKTSRLLPPANEVWGKVIFSEACVKNSVHVGEGWGLVGSAWSRGCLVWGEVVPGLGGGGCLVPGDAWPGGAWSWGVAWSGGCLVGGVCVETPQWLLLWAVCILLEFILCLYINIWTQRVLV